MRLLFLTRRLSPAICGVGDFTRHLAQCLARQGWEVGIASDLREPRPALIPGVEGLQGEFDWGPNMVSLVRDWQPDWVSLQWVPHLYHRLGFVPGAGPFLAALRAQGIGTHAMLHELWGTGGGPTRRLAGALQRWSTQRVIRHCEPVGVPVRQWHTLLTGLYPRKSWTYCPVGATILPPESPARERSESSTPVFGIFAPSGAGKNRVLVQEIVFRVLEQQPRARCWVVSADSAAYPEFLAHPRCQVWPASSEAEVSSLLSGLRVLISPFVDGMSGRRTSVISALAHALPVVTNRGPLTDPLWEESPLLWAEGLDDFVRLTLGLLGDSDAQQKVAKQSASFFRAHFTWERVADVHLGFLLSKENSPRLREAT